MEYPLIIAGRQILRAPFTGSSPFYPGYSYRIANASSLDIASAIGAARQAEPGSLAKQQECLQKAADAFFYSAEDVEHAVRLTGMPIRLVAERFAQIPDILREIPRQLGARFERIGRGSTLLSERIESRLVKALVPHSGFCYAISPGNDPRASAIVAANLAALGIPFVLRASIRDVAAPRLIQALIAGGLDPHFASLIFLDRDDPLTGQNHARLTEAASIIWTFGPQGLIDRTLRYQAEPQQASINLEGLVVSPGDTQALHALLVEWGPQGLDRRMRPRADQRDLFAGKTVLQHAAGNCAAITWGPFTERTGNWLYESIGYAIVCTATKSVMAVEGGAWSEAAAALLDSLVVGDPLDPETQVGYIDPVCLDYLAELRQKHTPRAAFLGGKRLSAIQATPLLVHSQAHLPDFFGQEIPAYVLAVRNCPHLEEAIQQVNAYTGTQPRLAVSIQDFQKDQLSESLLGLHAHTILVGQPTSRLLPAFHEGNDYALLLTQPRFIAY